MYQKRAQVAQGLIASWPTQIGQPLFIGVFDCDFDQGQGPF